jgi:hypothetical protein
MIINGQLYHHGIKGQKWGKRRFQNKDGSWTPAGRQRYGEGSDAKQNLDQKKTAYKTAKKDYNKAFNKAYNKQYQAFSPIKKHRAANDARWLDAVDKAEASNAARKEYKQAKKDYKREKQEARNTPEAKAARKAKAVKAAKVGAGVAGKALAAYCAKKVHDYVRDKNTQIHIKKAQKLTEDWFSKQVKDLYANEAITGKLDHDLAGKVLDYVDKSKRRNDIVNGRIAAKKDKFSTAAKNVAFDYLEKKKYYG